MDMNTIKRKIRKLKSVEITLKYGKDNYKGQRLLWHEFFDCNEDNKAVKYPLSYLLTIENSEYKKIAGEFLDFIYSDFFSYLEVDMNYNFNKSLLLKLGLPFDSDICAVKKRFRQLALLYHPDTGGNPQKFIELMEIYRELIRNIK